MLTSEATRNTHPFMIPRLVTLGIACVCLIVCQDAIYNVQQELQVKCNFGCKHVN